MQHEGVNKLSSRPAACALKLVSATEKVQQSLFCQVGHILLKAGTGGLKMSSDCYYIKIILLT